MPNFQQPNDNIGTPGSALGSNSIALAPVPINQSTGGSSLSDSNRFSGAVLQGEPMRNIADRLIGDNSPPARFPEDGMQLPGGGSEKSEPQGFDFKSALKNPFIWAGVVGVGVIVYLLFRLRK